MEYRRARTAGGTYFFTLNLADRHSDVLVRHVDILRTVIHQVKARHAFSQIATVVMPDHIHAIWRLPPGDDDYPARWGLIKAAFSRALPQREIVGSSRQGRRERGIWQRRYWEHQIRDQQDLARHVDYIHFNPVKHGWVERVADWPHSTFHGYVARGMLSADWGGAIGESGGFGER